MLEKAITIAVNAHFGQEDRNGQPYILHILRVMLKGKNNEEQITGALHDLIEDTDWTLEGLRLEGFSREIIDAVDAITRRDDERYEEYIHRLSQDPLAVKVKLSDLEDNMEIRRLPQVLPADSQQLNRYLQAHKKLSAIKERVFLSHSDN